MIEDYSFGSIKINNQNYHHDVQVNWNDDVIPWEREGHHLFQRKDLQKALVQDPGCIVLGTGASGAARVAEEVKPTVDDKNIDLVVEETEEAVEQFNNLQKEGEKIIGLFHITC